MKFLVASAVFAFTAEAASLRRINAVTVGSVSAYQAAEREDEQYIDGSWRQLAKELHQVQNAVSPATGLLQVSNHTSMNHTSVNHTSMNHTQDKLNAEQMRKVMDATKALTGKAMLAPALGMLHGLYDDQKSRISGLNKREQKSKERFAEQEKQHNEKMAHFKDLLDNHKVSKGFYDNSTHDENRLFNYWKSCRDRAHRQFHTQLKLTHGLMDKEKGMINAYNKALADPEPTKEGKKQFQQTAQQVAPEIVFMQDSVKEYCRSTLKVVTEEMNSLSAKQPFPHAE